MSDYNIAFSSIIPWIGGKRRLAKRILPIFPHHTCYVEPFCGAAALFFMKEPSKVEVINDINSELITLYRVIQHHLEEFMRQFKWALVSRQMFDWLKITDTSTLTDIQRAARFFYLQKMAFGGRVRSQAFGSATTTPPTLNLLRIEEDLSQAHLRLARTYVEHLTWQECIYKYDREHTLFYCDPPYWGTEGYGVDFTFDNYVQLSEMAKNIKGKMVISVNDIPEMRDVFSDLCIDTADIQYTVGRNKPKATKELIIKNW